MRNTLTRRTHDLAAQSAKGLVPVVVVDGLARVGWILRQVDIHYGSSPERRSVTVGEVNTASRRPERVFRSGAQGALRATQGRS